VRLGANSSYDPDQDDQISFNWKEGSVNISDKMNFEMPFTHGIHTLVLEVRDRNGGISQATVHFKVLWTEISTVISTDPTEIAAGTKLDIIVTMSNVGDVDSEDMTLEVLVDGKSISSKTVPGLSAGGSTKQLFQWKATKGTHSITAKIGDQTWNKAITVDAAPAAPPSTAAQDALPFILIIIVAVILVAWGWWALGRK
jgi:archaellum component FlaG (FlaF/FlaG flagellin family)